MAEAMEHLPPYSARSRNLTGQCTKDKPGSSQLTFHLFNHLPPELRQMIFQACLPRRVFCFSYERSISPLKRKLDVFRKKPAALPLIAFVCKEAYAVSKLFVREFEVDCIEIISIEWRQYICGATKIRFDLDLDTLIINYRGIVADDEPAEDDVYHENYLKGLHNGPFSLAMKPNVNVNLDMVALVGPRGRYSQSRIKWLTARPFRDCITQRSHCTVVLAATSFCATDLEIQSSGLFGMFGEERSVFIDINDSMKIDQYESYSRHLRSGAGDSPNSEWSYFPEHVMEGAHREGAGRYGSDRTGILDSERTHGEDAAATPTVPGVAEQDAASALLLIQQTWLEANRCFEPDDQPLVPWTGDFLWRKWDDEHHVVKYWLGKLPTFSFVAMYQVTGSEGSTREFF